jgi:hypothetical protein
MLFSLRPDSTAVNVILAGHVWEALEFLEISFDEDRNGGLERGGGKPNKLGTEVERPWDEGVLAGSS